MMSIPKYVVNLKRRANRLESFFERCPFSDSEIKVVEAFDGKHVEQNAYETNTYKDMLDKCHLMPGEIGCFLSHLHLWKKIVNEVGVGGYAMVFEDDTFFCDDFMERWSRIKEQMAGEVCIGTILYIGGRPSPLYKTFSGKTISDDIMETHIKEDRDRTTHAYVISRDGAEFLVRTFYEKMKNPYTNDKKYHFRAVDHYMLMAFRKTNTVVHNSMPHLCWSPIVSGESDTIC